MINPFKKTYTKHEHNLFLFLKNIEIFSKLTNQELSLFLPHMHERSFEQNEVVFFRNDPSHALYLLRKGEVELNLDINEEFEPLITLDTTCAIGESCLLKSTKRQLNAFVISETAEFYVIPQDNIFNIFEGNTALKAKMLESLATIYNNYNADLFKAYKSSMGFFNLRELYNR
ncbi:MAG: cyclic nucleotide-binding domain-containing protein [Fulvivirga sp.]|nr:cyclic nucleotide-binding domain-containing protein [Fulvivirga sp.]